MSRWTLFPFVKALQYSMHLSHSAASGSHALLITFVWSLYVAKQTCSNHEIEPYTQMSSKERRSVGDIPSQYPCLFVVRVEVTDIVSITVVHCHTLVQFDSCLLAGSYSPAYHLRSFLDEVHPALTTVTRLDLYLEDTGGSAVTGGVVGRALAALLAACPALSTLSCPAGSLSSAFLQRVDGSVYPPPGFIGTLCRS